MNLPQGMKRLRAGFVSDSWLFAKDSTVFVDRSIFAIQWLSSGVLLWLLAGMAVQAQIVPDASLGGERSSIAPRALGGSSIQGGAIRGSNLFHSFSDFNIGNAQRVYFANPAGIQNIITRVTGSFASNIFGTLGVDGSANLFLMNPNGILFGQNARLDLRGSFLATTATAIGFGNQGNFSAINPTAPPLLTIQPSAVLFTQLKPSAIASRATLTVNPEQSLKLIGGAISLEDSTLTARSGRIELGSINAPATVGLDQPLVIPDGTARADIMLLGSELDVRGTKGGNIAIAANNLTASAKTAILNGATGQVQSANDIRLNTTGLIRLTGSSYIDNSLYQGAIGNSGNIVIEAGELSLENGQLAVLNFGNGRTGDLSVRVRDRVLLSDNSSFLNRIEKTGSGQGGNIDIRAGSLTLQDISQIDTSSFGKGNGGNILVRVRDQLKMTGNDQLQGNLTNQVKRSAIFTQIVPGSTASKAGDIDIEAGSIAMSNGALIKSNSTGIGNAGQISIRARDSIQLDGETATIASGTISNAKGDGGNIDITTGRLQLGNGASIDSSMYGTGNAKDIVIRADRVTLSDGATIASRVGENAIGNGGNIEITTQTLQLDPGAALVSASFGQGNAGNISIRALDGVTLSGDKTTILSTVEPGAIGNGGNVDINARSVKLTNGAEIRTDLLEDYSSKPIKAGDVRINASDFVEVSGTNSIGEGSGINSGAVTSRGNGGNIFITSDRVRLADASFQNAYLSVGSSSSEGSIGGSITIKAREFEAFNSGLNTISIAAKQPGKITIHATEQATLVNSTLTASAIGAFLVPIDIPISPKAGDIEVTAPRIKLDQQSSIESGGIAFSFATFPISGGNISINAREALILRHGSRILTDVSGDGEGNGGNIKINAGFIVAPGLEASNITANAIVGQGGNVVIDTKGLFGIEPRSRIIDGLSSITASSELGVQGNVSIAQPDIQPTQGTIELPTAPIPGNQLSQSCPRGNAARSLGSFVVSGRGSAPANPINALDGNVPITPLATLNEISTNRSRAKLPSIPTEIVEAQGWIKSPNGRVELVARSSGAKITTIADCPP